MMNDIYDVSHGINKYAQRFHNIAIIANDNSTYYIAQFIGNNLDPIMQDIATKIKSWPIVFDYKLSIITNSENIRTIVILKDTKKLFNTIRIGDKFISYDNIDNQFQENIINCDLTPQQARNISETYIEKESDNEFSSLINIINIESLIDLSTKAEITNLNELPIEIQNDFLSYL